MTNNVIMLPIDKYMAEVIKQVGYKETGTNITKYGKFFDTPIADGGAWRYFNTHKQGSQWCALMPHYCLYILFGAKATRTMLNEPSPSKNCGAGVQYLYNYLKKAGLTHSKPRRGDFIFFKGKERLKHVGVVENVDSKHVYTIEGNKGNMVKRCTYKLGDSAIYGYGSPDWSVVEPEPQPQPTPDKKPVIKASNSATSFDKYYARSWEVTRDVLNIRDGAGTAYKSLCKMPKGAKCRCYGYYTNNWLYVRYETDKAIYEGFASKNHLK